MARRRNQKGQALVMIGVALFAMAGMMGLAVDLGWSFYVHKTARTAADGAALAGVKEVFAGIKASGAIANKAGPYTCGAGGVVICQTLTGCDDVGLAASLRTACKYAEVNGFKVGGHGSRQNVRIEAGIGTPPTAPGVAAMYWVHVVTAENMPQLFSSLLGNTNGTASADATGAIINQVVNTTLILLNRNGDPGDISKKTKGKSPPANNDAFLQGSGSITASGGISLASTSSAAGQTGGSSSVTAPFTQVAGAGQADWCNATNPCSSVPSGASIFDDPEAGKGQPPFNPNGATLPLIAVTNGDFASVPGCPAACPQGVYYYYSAGSGLATADQLRPSTGTVFKDPNTNFGTYVFVGGMNVSGSITFGPGEFVMAGVGTTSGNEIFNVSGDISGGTAASSTGAAGDAGRIVILTNGSYNGPGNLGSLISQIPNQRVNQNGQSQFPLIFADSEFKSGNANSTIYGLNPASPDLPASLRPFAPFALWQDQQYSNMQYDANGNVTGPAASQPNPLLTLWGGQTSSVGLYGAVYMPRGSYLDMHSSTNLNGTVQFVGGEVLMQGSPSMTLTTPSTPITKLTVSLVH